MKKLIVGGLAALAIGLGAAPIAQADPSNGVPTPNPTVAADTGSPYYAEGYDYATRLISTSAWHWGDGTVRHYVAIMGGPGGLCLQGAEIGWLNAQPLSGDYLNPNVDIDQLYQGCMAGTQTMLRTYE